MPTFDWIGKIVLIDHHRKVPHHLLRDDPKLSVGNADSGILRGAFRRPGILLCLSVSVIFGFCLPLHAEEVPSSQNGVLWLGFPLRDRRPDTTPINLAEDKQFGPAFLKQLERQAILLAARDELGAVTRDAFLGDEPAPGCVRLENTDELSVAAPRYENHRGFAEILERKSRNEYPDALEKLGLVRFEPSSDDPGDPVNDVETDEDAEKAIATLLDNLAIIPHFEAVRRTHALIRERGETLPRLALLVRGYSQLYLLTNFAPHDTRRVFQARAVLYAQRAVAKYDESVETLSLRAGAWAFTDYHRLARTEFEHALLQTRDMETVWTELARAYADFDFETLDSWIEKLEGRPERSFAKFLRFLLLDLTSHDLLLTRPYAESIIADLPDCERLYQRAFACENFVVPAAPDGSPFYVHLARRIAPAMRSMKRLPQPVVDAVKLLGKRHKENSGILSELFAAPPVKNFSTEKHYDNLAALIKSLRETGPATDPGEPSLQTLATLLEDREFQTVTVLTFHMRGRNGHPEEVILASEPAIGTHPGYYFLGDTIRDPREKAKFLERMRPRSVPYERLSQNCVGFEHGPLRFFDGPFFSPFTVACRFADKENVRDMYLYQRLVGNSRANGGRLFTVDRLMAICPRNPYAIQCDLTGRGRLDDARAETILRDFSGFPYLCLSIADHWYRREDRKDQAFELYCKIFKDFPTRELTNWLRDRYLEKNRPDEAVRVLQEYIASPLSDSGLSRPRAALNIGRIRLQTGWPWGLLLQGSHRSVLAYINAHGSSESRFATRVVFTYSRLRTLWTIFGMGNGYRARSKLNFLHVKSRSLFRRFSHRCQLRCTW